MGRGLSRPGNGGRVIISFDLGIYSSANNNPLGSLISDKWKGMLDTGILFLCSNNIHGSKSSGAQVDFPHEPELVGQ